MASKSQVQESDIRACPRGCQWVKAFPFEASIKTCTLFKLDIDYKDGFVNRGAPGVGAHHLPTPTTVTFTRFVPAVQARYDYRLTIFISTSRLLPVLGYRDDQA
ncbi:hypothetical protein D5086_020230 [Populus alba]|uniref:Uncharacterized protein n=1 Tax=Populus alba TaxID=43335 RepID=A0ACC4BK38_POPAL